MDKKLFDSMVRAYKSMTFGEVTEPQLEGNIFTCKINGFRETAYIYACPERVQLQGFQFHGEFH
jgi:hypothetical protein